MKRRLIAVLLGIALLAGIAFCAAATVYLDTENHWAAAYIDEATSRGLFAGVDELHFAPDTEMDRAMFVTVLGRAAGIEPDSYDPAFLADYFTDVDPDAYYAPYVAWAVSVGVTDGIGNGQFAPQGKVTREQMACFLRSCMDLCGYFAPPAEEALSEEEAQAVSEEIPALPEEFQRPEFTPTPREALSDEWDVIEAENHGFSDFEDISDWAKESVLLLKDSGLFEGAPDGMGGFAFLPKKTATRAEGAVVFLKLQELLAQTERPDEIAVNNIVLNQDTAEVQATATLSLSAMIFPLDATNQRVLWYSTDREILTVDADGCVTGVAEGEAEVHARSANGIDVFCTVTVTPAPEPEPEVLILTPAEGVYAPTSWYEKCMLIFGQLYDDPRLAYANADEAKPHMTTIKVPAWDIDASGEKYTRYFYLEIHENVAQIVAQIFDEIYALPEQVPIHSLGGYRWDGKCEHSIGLAIDINPTENYYCTTDGTAVVGKYFKPGEDPYSIPVMGAVDQIFAKYGFKRGIYWNCGYKDYMHYSYFGT